MDSSSDHRLRQHQSYLRRRRTADCDCARTTDLSIKPRWRTDILSHWSRRCSTGPKECLSPHPNQGRRRVQNRATIPIWGDKSSAEQRPLKRGMTLPEMPEWRTRVHLTTEKSSGDKCTQRAGIRVPEESTYAPSIRKMISAPREFTARAQSQRQREQTKRSLKRWKKSKGQHEASRNMKQVEIPSKSMAKASQKERPKRVEKWDESKCKMRWKQAENETKQVDQDQPRNKRSRNPPKSKDEGYRKTRQSKKITISLPKHDGNQQPIWV